MRMVLRMIKIQICGLLSFLLMTILIATTITFTPFKEEWSYFALIAALCVSCFIVAVFQGGSAGKRGLLVGLLTASVTIILICLIVNTVFGDEFQYEQSDIYFIVPLIFGAVGGVVGTNINK